MDRRSCPDPYSRQVHHSAALRHFFYLQFITPGIKKVRVKWCYPLRLLSWTYSDNNSRRQSPNSATQSSGRNIWIYPPPPLLGPSSRFYPDPPLLRKSRKVRFYFPFCPWSPYSFFRRRLFFPSIRFLHSVKSEHIYVYIYLYIRPPALKYFLSFKEYKYTFT